MSRILFTSMIMAGLALGGCSDGGDEAPPPLIDQCLDPMDRMIIADHTAVDGGVPDGGMVVEVGIIVEGCVRGSCITELFGGDDEALATCVNTCVDTTEVSGLSTGCRQCFLQQISCGTEFCVNQCTGSSEDLCHQCVEDFCGPEYRDCLGF